MPKITLTRALAGHKASDTIDVDDAAAETLRMGGYADQPADGDSHHDELANTDADNHGAKTSAPVVDGTPQPVEVHGTAPDTHVDLAPGGDSSSADADNDATGQGDEPFDPTDHTVADVQAYLADASDEERERVLGLERDGKARTSLLS